MCVFLFCNKFFFLFIVIVGSRIELKVFLILVYVFVILKLLFLKKEIVYLLLKIFMSIKYVKCNGNILLMIKIGISYVK